MKNSGTSGPNVSTESAARNANLGRRSSQAGKSLDTAHGTPNQPYDGLDHIIPSPITEQWNTHYMPIFLHQFSTPGNGDRCYGFLDFLPALYHETNEASCLFSATNAVAMAYMTNIYRKGAWSRTHQVIYGQALTATKEAVEDPLLRVRDDTIIAIWLLGIYEVRQPQYSWLRA